ncbi:MAG: c-type cytochrome, partial [Armatimonadetes bacterium]|nr:c-type cytochrome [Armatimonadota bacterium]NIO96338.1 c-type cytochrome [Armatimonadota bacterium]
GYYFASEPDGAEIFKRENCVKCHSLRGQGIGVRDLTDVANRRSREWMRDQIVNPRLHDPHPGMPSFAHLSRRELSALIDHLEGK